MEVRRSFWGAVTIYATLSLFLCWPSIASIDFTWPWQLTGDYSKDYPVIQFAMERMEQLINNEFVASRTDANDAGKAVLLDGSGYIDETFITGILELEDLSDVTISSPADNEVIAYDNGTSAWINQTAAEAGLAAVSHNHDASNITSGLLVLERGGTEADLSATGGTDQFVKQESAGAAFTVSALTESEISDLGTTIVLDSDIGTTVQGYDAATAKTNAIQTWTASQYFQDPYFRIMDDDETPTLAAFELSGLTRGVTRTLTVPDADGTIAYTGHSHTKSDITDTPWGWSDVSKTGSSLADLATRDHTDLTGAGSNSHTAIDTHLAAEAPHAGHEETANKGAANGSCAR